MNTSTEDLRWKEYDPWIHESSNHHQSDIHDELGGTRDKCWYAATNINNSGSVIRTIIEISVFNEALLFPEEILSQSYSI